MDSSILLSRVDHTLLNPCAGWGEIADLKKAVVGSILKVIIESDIRTAEDIKDFFERGCERLGANSAVEILAGQQATGY